MTFQTIITVSALAKNLDSSNWLVLDCRGGVFHDQTKYKKFLKGHIPNAYYYCFTGNYTTDSGTKSSTSCCGTTKTGQIIENLKDYGFDQTTQIILYDSSSSSFTDSMWLLLRSIGCNNVAVLQGGFTLWQEQEMPLTICKNHIETEVAA